MKRMKGLSLSLCLIMLLSSVWGTCAFAEDVQEKNGIQEEVQEENNLSMAAAKEDYEVSFADGEVYTYNGQEIKPKVTVKEIAADTVLAETDYTVAYINNTNAGTAKAAISIAPNIQIEKTFTIKAQSIQNCSISVSPVSYVYDGKAKTPAVTVKDNGRTLTLNTDYTLSYSANKAVGTAKVTVKAKGTNYTGSKAVEYQIQFGTPKITGTSASSTKVTVNWSAVAGANGYVVYRSTKANGSYKAVKTITSGSTTSFSDSKLKIGQTYYYKLRAYCTASGKKQYSDYSAVKAQRVQPARPSVKSISSASYNTLLVKWGKVSGAKGYAIYRSTSENGTYTKVGTVKSGATTLYTDKKCTSGRTYFYKVRAYSTVSKKNIYGDYSGAKSGKAVPVRAKISSKTSMTDTSIKLNWYQVSGASGYEIYRSETKSGGYKLVKTITKGSTLKWTNSGLPKGKVFYYQVRAYRTVSGQKVYGAFSAAYKKAPGGWRYVKGYKLYYNGNGQLVRDVSGIIGKQSSYVIKVNKKRNTVTVYAKDGKNGYIIPVKAFVCSVGKGTPSGTFYTPAKYRWKVLMGPVYGQWSTRITGGILFHSVYYNSYNNNNTLAVNKYNLLGVTDSHGCCRLTAGDAKWIYDNCKLKTKVIIYSSSNAGPLGKPSASKLPSWHTWDPTDPTAYYKCKKRGCH